ncbi:hypothetical protein IT157_01340, partial [bacterium]|nr:hypothetical protein [bacterium]
MILQSLLLFAQQNPHGNLKIDCQVCHTTTAWSEFRKDSPFDHASQTQFPLVGRHVGVRCIECHSTPVFKDAGTQCLDCHVDVHRGQFSNDCSRCHSPKEWIDRAQFEQMHDATRFPLIGLHRNLDCQACHANGQYVNLPMDCRGCHMEQFEATTEPNHVLAGFSMECLQCHALEKAAWKEPGFEHTPNFPLTGGHAVNNCTACHAVGYQSTSSSCVSCHETNYNAAQNPRHELPSFPTSCEECHTVDSWRPAQFERHNETDFPLTGAHIQTSCAQCHVGGQYTGTPTTCIACHDVDYQSADDPVHTPDLFPNTCEQCHSTASWANANFENHDQTDFPLTGAHAQVDCISCHANGYTGTPTDCWSCHEADYSGTTDPNHSQEQYPQACTVCHSTANWNETTFDHNATQFPL